jgi:hypothetical protein
MKSFDGKKVAVLLTLLLAGITAPLLLSTDSDGLSFTNELLVGSSPFDSDTDGDGIADELEVNKYNTNPTREDTDNDGLNDTVEIETKTDAIQKDTDNDGLDDGKEVELGTNPVNPDTDNDGLEDGKEIEIGSDPHRIDSDNDGLNDVYEHKLNKTLKKDIDPARKTVLVEIDYDKGNRPSNQTLQKVKNTFEKAPVSNYDNSTGIDIVLLVDDKEQLSKEVTMYEYKTSVSENLYDRDNCGFYHIVIVDRAAYPGVWGITEEDINGILIRHNDGNAIVAASIVHEMGHQLGLLPRDYAGIDSNGISFNEYPSVMNYNNNRIGGVKTVELSGGEGFNDWKHIQESLEDSTPQVNYNHSQQEYGQRCANGFA